MSRRRRRPSSRPFLGPQGEQAWRDLRAQLEWSKGLWVAFLFSSASEMVGELEQRSKQLITQTGGSVMAVRAHKPDDLREVFDATKLDHLRPGNLFWIEALRCDADGVHPTGWDAAWQDLLRKLNVERETLRTTRSGLLLAMPLALKTLARECAPDLWSIRSLTLEPGGEEFFRPLQPVSSSATASSPLAAKLEISPGIVGPAASYARLAIAASEDGRWTEAIENAERAVAESTPNTTALVDALTLLVGIEMRSGDHIAAARHAKTAIAKLERSVRSNPDQMVLFWRRLASLNGVLGNALLATGDVEGASDAFEEIIRWARPPLVGKHLDLEQLWLRADGLVRSAHSKRLLGAEADAVNRGTQAVKEARLLAANDHEDGLGLLARALYEFGLVSETMHEIQRARDAYEETLEILDRISRVPQRLDRSLVLVSIARVSRNIGDLQRAKSAATDALSHARQLTNESPLRCQVSILALATLCTALADLGEHVTIRPALIELQDTLAELAPTELDPRTGIALAQSITDAVRALRNIETLQDGLVPLANRGLELWRNVKEDGLRTHESYIGSARLEIEIIQLFVNRGALNLARELAELGIQEIHRAPSLGTDPAPITHVHCTLLEARAYVVGVQGKWEEARLSLEESIRLRRRLTNDLEKEEPVLELVTTQLRLAEALERLQQWAEASNTLEDALQILDRYDEDNGEPSIWIQLLRAEGLVELSRTLLESDKIQEAKSRTQQASLIIQQLSSAPRTPDEEEEFDFVTDRLRFVKDNLNHRIKA